MSGDAYYHGGAPGLRPHHSILSATKLGMSFDYNKPWIAGPVTYDATKVYLTSHLGTALGYASRYVDKLGRSVPGDVYEVRPVDTPTPDPDYKHFGEEGLFVRCREAKIIKVVERNVQLSVREQNRHAWPYQVWEQGSPIFTEDGEMIASKQMQDSGVMQEYLALLPKWADISEVNAHGQITPRNARYMSLDVLLDFFSHIPLERMDHRITVRRSGWRRRKIDYRCCCGSLFDHRISAARHQAAERELRLIAAHNLSDLPFEGDPTDHLIAQVAAVGGDHWAWYCEPDRS